MENIELYRKDLEEALLSNDAKKAEDILFQEYGELTGMELIDRVISPVIAKIGDDWESGDVALSQVFLSSKICEDIVSKLMAGNDVSLRTIPIIAVVSLDDYHLLGARVVRMAIQSAGYKVLDYGRQDADSLMERLCADDVQFILVSTLMLRSALKVKQVREMIETRGCNIHIVVGGAPFRFDRSLWKKVGADYSTQSPLDALDFICRSGGDRT